MPTFQIFSNLGKVEPKHLVWEVVVTLPNHGQHYCHVFKKKWQALDFANLNLANPNWAKVTVHPIDRRYVSHV
jgi:hypothetical protein